MADEECNCPPEGLPAWMGTFADLMALLMCFFVLLLSFSEMDVLKFKQIAGSMKYAFGVQSVLKVKDIPKGTSVIAQEFTPGRPDPTPIEVLMQKTTEMTKAKLDFKDGDSSRVGGSEFMQKTESKEQDDIIESTQALAKKVATELKDEVESGAIEVEALGQQLIIRIREKGAFPSGSGFLQPQFRPIIRKIAIVIADVAGEITISGHTDDEDIQSDLYRSNWDLSAQRSISVAHEMLNINAIKSRKMAVVGFGSGRPLNKNNTAVQRRRNRRVEISILQGKPTETDQIPISFAQ
jgi:chemotaxis protein MotB